MAEHLTGRVVAGLGDLAGWMHEYRLAYQAASGADLVPGSLNIELAREWRLPPEPRIRLEADEVGVGMTLVPCHIEGRSGYIARTDRNEAGVGRHPRTIVEIVSEVRLRQELDLEDGDVVRVVVPSATEDGEPGIS